MKNLVDFINEGRRKVAPVKLDNKMYQAAADAVCKEYRHYDDPRSKAELIKYLKNFAGNVYLDDMDLVVGDKTVGEMWDDGTLSFPLGFPKELAMAIRDEFAYNTGEGSGDPTDYYIIIGDNDNCEWDEYAETQG